MSSFPPEITDLAQAVAGLAAQLRHEARPWSREDVLSPSQAAKRLRWDSAECRRWLDANGLVLALPGREVVIWGDVLDAIRGSTARRSRATGTSARRAVLP